MSNCAAPLRDQPSAGYGLALKYGLDRVYNMDAILITMIRRPTKVDPKLRSLQEKPPIRMHKTCETLPLSTAISSILAT